MIYCSREMPKIKIVHSQRVNFQNMQRVIEIWLTNYKISIFGAGGERDFPFNVIMRM